MRATALTVADHLHAGATPYEGTSRVASRLLSNTHHPYTHARTTAYTSAHARRPSLSRLRSNNMDIMSSPMHIHTPPLLRRNENGNYVCECAEGWNGGGVNQKCEEGYCKCTGNQGFAKADDVKFGGRVLVEGYDYGDDYGNYCAKFDERHYDGDDSKRWALEPW